MFVFRTPMPIIEGNVLNLIIKASRSLERSLMAKINHLPHHLKKGYESLIIDNTVAIKTILQDLNNDAQNHHFSSDNKYSNPNKKVEELVKLLEFLHAIENQINSSISQENSLIDEFEDSLSQAPGSPTSVSRGEIDFERELEGIKLNAVVPKKSAPLPDLKLPDAPTHDIISSHSKPDTSNNKQHAPPRPTANPKNSIYDTQRLREQCQQMRNAEVLLMKKLPDIIKNSHKQADKMDNNLRKLDSISSKIESATKLLLPKEHFSDEAKALMEKIRAESMPVVPKHSVIPKK